MQTFPSYAAPVPARAHGKTTLIDVARRAGVHPSTVSRTLTRPDAVAQPTRRRVEAAISALGYRPNRAARRLATGRTGAIAIVVPDIVNPYFALMVQAAQATVRARGFDVLLADTGQDPDEEEQALKSLSRQADGLIVCVPQRVHRAPDAALGGTPTLFVNRPVRGYPFVLIDQRGIINAALDHLYGLGHRRIAHVAGPRGYWAASERIRHARRWATLHPDAAVSLIGPGVPSYEGGRQALGSLGQLVTAVVAFNDLMALGIMSSLEASGFKVPADVSVVGSDDVPVASMAAPPLTTVAAPFADAGNSAALVLLGCLTGDDTTTIPTRFSGCLVVRGSTGRPKVRRSPSGRRHDG